MKMLITIGLLFILAGSSMAADYNYSFLYFTGGAKGTAGTKLDFSSQLGAVDGIDWEHGFSLPDPGSPIHAAFYNVNGVYGWDGPTGWYYNDCRAPLAPGQKRTIDNLYVWAESSATSQDIYFYRYHSASLSNGLTYKLSLLSVPTGITYTGPREWGPDHGTIVLPFYNTDDGTTGYRFKVELTAVPEPSSLLALAGGLAGVGGTFLRRRKS